MHPLDVGAFELARRVRDGEVTAEAATLASLERIAAANSELGAFLTVSAEPALECARLVDERRRRGEQLGPLAGVPIAIKDALATRDAPTTAASRILLRTLRAGGADPYDGYRSPYDATVVARLRGADAILVGKTNMDELAMGSSNENSAFFPARNPHDPTRTPGGSSGGSAVAVAARMTPIALGSDTGGSVRQPASMTGVVGLKPSWGRVSRYGLFAFASSLDQVGVFAHDVRDAALVLETIAGACADDATCATSPVPPLVEAAALRPKSLRIGVPFGLLGDGVEPDVRARFDEVLDVAKSCGATIVPIELRAARYAVAAYYVIATAEASSNLSRYDGVRFGLRVHDGVAPLAQLYEDTRGRGFGDEVKRRILLGTFVLSSGYYDAYYLRAQRARTLVRREFEAAFRDVDLVATPTSPTVAFPLGSRTSDPLSMYLADVFTLPPSLAGLPALSLPCGKGRPSEGGPELPVGLQLVAPSFEEARLVSAAATIEAGLAERGIGPRSPRA
jgi:aspartyl-tRNA(Asn)/glutamyl-tRNA(Gln) amidotransferase subunit A